MGKINDRIAVLLAESFGDKTAIAALMSVRKPGSFNDDTVFDTIQRKHHGMVESLSFLYKEDGSSVTRCLFHFPDGGKLVVTRFGSKKNQFPAFSFKVIPDKE